MDPCQRGKADCRAVSSCGDHGCSNRDHDLQHCLGVHGGDFRKVFPVGSIVQGVIIGIAVQRSGRGLDGRFPLIAGVAAWIGAFSGNLFIALVFTGMETSDIGGDWLEILRSFYVNTVSIIDVIYAFCAVAVAAFFAKRRLNRYEVFALRKHAARQNG